MISNQYESDRAKLQKIRLLLAKRNREIALLQRKIDEVPSRTELSQYQRRFIELFNQSEIKSESCPPCHTMITLACLFVLA